MSRIGKKTIVIATDVKVIPTQSEIKVEGPKGSITIGIPQGFELILTENQIEIKEKKNTPNSAMHGLIRSLIQNAISGVVTPWTKTLELVGVGFRAETTGKELVLSLGFSHPVKIQAPNGITFSVSENKIIVAGCDKYVVGEVAATIRRVKKPEPYKGKGIRYLGEYIRKKLGKAAKTVGATGAK